MDFPQRPQTRELEIPTPMERMHQDIREIKTKVDKLETHLSFLETYRPKIERLIAICHIAIRGWSILWRLLVAASVLIGLYLGGQQLGWWPKL